MAKTRRKIATTQNSTTTRRVSDEAWVKEDMGDDGREELDKELYEGAGFAFGRWEETGPEGFAPCWSWSGVAMVATVPQ